MRPPHDCHFRVPTTKSHEAQPNPHPERDKERDYELEQSIEMATLFRQREDIEPIDTDE